MRLAFVLIVMTFFYAASAQNFAVSWGEELKIKKGVADLRVINADESGVYMLEGRIKAGGFIVLSAEKTYSLYKFDRSYNKVYNEDFDKHLKDAGIKTIQFLKDQMYVFAQDYSRKDKALTVYGFKADRITGKPTTDMIELGSFDIDSKEQTFNFNIIPNQDSTQFLLMADLSSETRVMVSITPLDANLKRKPATRINFNFPPKSFLLENIIETKDNAFVITGKEFTQTPTGKGSKTVTTFKDYVFAKYDNKGQKLFDFSASTEGRIPFSGKAKLTPDGNLSLAAFYMSDRKTREVNGFLLYKFDLTKGSMIHSSFKEMSKATTGNGVKTTGTENTKNADSSKDNAGLSKDYKIRSMISQPNGSLLILAELSESHTETSWTQDYNAATKSYTSRMTTDYVWVNADILAIQTDASGNVNWINSLPKYQLEYSSATGDIGRFYNGVFAEAGGKPFFSSFNYLVTGDKVAFLINDNPANEKVTKPGDKVEGIPEFAKTSVYGITLDLKTGAFQRKQILSNIDEPIMMPRLGYAIGNEFYLPAKKGHLMGKTEFKMGKIVVTL